MRAPAAAAALFLACLIAAPMAAAALVPVFALVLAAAAVARSKQLSRLPAYWSAVLRSSRPFAALGIIGLYLLINASWSLVPAFAFRIAGYFFALVSLSLLAIRAAQQAQPVLVRSTAIGLCVGAALASAYLLFEIVSDDAALRLLISHVPALLERRSDVEDARIVALPAYYANKSMLALSVCLWPVLLMIASIGIAHWRRTWLLAALAGGAVAIALSEHETSKLACLGGALIFCAAQFSLKAARWLTIAGWIAAITFVVPISGLMYAQGLHAVSWLPYSARDRIVIWSYTAEQIQHAPVLGVGIGSARALRTETDGGMVQGTATDPAGFKRFTSYHSHNGYLQVWFETGAVGAGLLLALGLMLIATIEVAPAGAQAYLYAAFVTCALTAATSFSIWAPWFMASLALVPMLASIAIGLIMNKQPVVSTIPAKGAVPGMASGEMR